MQLREYLRSRVSGVLAEVRMPLTISCALFLKVRRHRSSQVFPQILCPGSPLLRARSAPGTEMSVLACAAGATSALAALQHLQQPSRSVARLAPAATCAK